MAREYRKNLIEVGLPLETINKASAREKSIRHGHPSTLHPSWARRPPWQSVRDVGILFRGTIDVDRRFSAHQGAA